MRRVLARVLYISVPFVLALQILEEHDRPKSFLSDLEVFFKVSEIV